MKKLLLFAAACITCASAFSQSFHQGVALGFYLERMDHVDQLVGSAITYKPEMNFVEVKNLSLSVAVPLSVGYAENYKGYYYNDEKSFGAASSLMVNVPVMVNLNLWGGSSKNKSKEHVGVFLGAGYGFHYVTETTAHDGYGLIVDSHAGGHSFGMALNAGVRIVVGHSYRSLDLSVSSYSGNDRYNNKSLGIGAMFNF